MFFDPTKPVRTRGGKPARVLTTDRKGSSPIVVLLEDGELYCVDSNGCYLYTGDEHPFDLVNAPQKRRGWIVPGVHDARMTVYTSRAVAQDACDRYSPGRRLIEISWEE